MPQVILGAYFGNVNGTGLRFADLGTGLGILPRQLNSRAQYETFAADLHWPSGIPEFRPLPLAVAYGIDRGPWPDGDWVHACYGPSRYYAHLYEELRLALQDEVVRAADVRYHEVNLTDPEALVRFIRLNEINAANLSYVLYELEESTRDGIVELVRKELSPPSLLIVTEPRDELHREGCIVEVYVGQSGPPMQLCFVSDGHFKGHVLPLDDYADFFGRFPIRFRA